MNDLSERAQRLGLSIDVIERKQLGGASSVTAFEAVLPDETRVAFSTESDLRAAMRLCEIFATTGKNITIEKPSGTRREALGAAGDGSLEGGAAAEPVDEEEEPPAFAAQSADIAPQSTATGLSFAERQAQRMSNRPSVAAHNHAPNVKSPIVAQGRTLV